MEDEKTVPASDLRPGDVFGDGCEVVGSTTTNEEPDVIWTTVKFRKGAQVSNVRRAVVSPPTE